MDPLYSDYNDDRYAGNDNFYNDRDTANLLLTTTDYTEYDDNVVSGGGDNVPPTAFATDPEPEPDYEARPGETFTPSVGVSTNQGLYNNNNRPERVPPPFGANGGSYHPELNYDPVPPDPQYPYSVPNIYSESLKEAFLRRNKNNRLYTTSPDSWPKEWSTAASERDRRWVEPVSRRREPVSSTPVVGGDISPQQRRWYEGDYTDQFLDTHDYYSLESAVVDPNKHFAKYE